MNLCEVMRRIVAGSGRTHRELASDMGMSDAYVSASVSRVCSGNDIGVGKLVSIADACGYDVELVSRETGERLTLG